MALQQKTLIDNIFDGSHTPNMINVTGSHNRYRIVLVGNSTVDKDQSDIVDSADLVIRFSKVPEYDTGLTGTKTDVVIVRVGSVTLRHEFFFKNIVNKTPWHDAKEYWFTGRPKDSDLSYIQTFIDEHSDFAARPLRYVETPPLFNYIFGT